MTSVHLDATTTGQTYDPFWRTLACAGRAAEGLREDWRQHLREVQREMPFKYLRFHGLFHDDLMIYREDAQGHPIYTWQYLDSLFDFLLSVGIKPFVELGFTPSALKSGEATIFWWKGNITPPKDPARWEALVQAFVRHCLSRYGVTEVRSWYFEVWNEPNIIGAFWTGTREDYFDLYQRSARAVKAVDPTLRVGGPATSAFHDGKAPWMEEFLAFCTRTGAPVDFLSCHPYPNTWALDTGGSERMGYTEPGRTARDLGWLKRIAAERLPHPVELHLTEWNSSPSPRDLVHDTAFMAPFVIRNNLESIGLVDSLGFWTFSDVFEEGGAGESQFHGGFGMVNVLGLKKAAYWGYWFLSRLGTAIIARGDGWIMTRRGQDLVLLIWNYAHYTPEFAAGQRDRLLPTDRYGVFAAVPPLVIDLDLHGLTGRWRVIERNYGRAENAYDAWVGSGCPESPTAEEVAILATRAQPQARIAYHATDTFRRQVTLDAHAVCMIEWQRIEGSD
jgi:xylan 1,4-beta-xylosidase